MTGEVTFEVDFSGVSRGRVAEGGFINPTWIPGMYEPKIDQSMASGKCPLETAVWKQSSFAALGFQLLLRVPNNLLSESFGEIWVQFSVFDVFFHDRGLIIDSNGIL